MFLPEFFGGSLTRLSGACTDAKSDLSFVLSTRFLWKVALIIAVSSFPLYVIKFVRSRLAPPSYSKLATA